MSASGKTDPDDDPTALARFGGLDVVARLIVEGYMIGQHKSPFKGSSVEFVEHRQYYPGDEIRHIDWRAYGKTGHYYVKEYEEETNLRAYLLLDCSGSMAFSGKTLSKYQYARQLAAALAYLLLSQRDACGLVAFDNQTVDRWEPSANRDTFGQIVHLLRSRRPGGEGSLSESIAQIQPTLKRRSLLFLLTDAFDELEPLAVALKRLRMAQHDVVLFQITAPEEETFPYKQPTEFRNLERAGHHMLVDPYRLRSLYLSRFQAFRQGLVAHCGAAGIEFVPLTTSEPYQRALGQFLALRSQNKRQR
ncbi:DUF58 domain-containing protein [Schlesneria sp. T3-172]|uniref:DUF58 domain-containing protein n=1 Tax=Schlesneria TaxID=656899 RepID=UPI002EF8CEE6